MIYNKDFAIIDDCAHNPGSYGAVFKTVSQLKYKNLLIVNAIRGNRGAQINKGNAETIGKWLKKFHNYYLLTTNCNDVVKPIDKVSPEEEKVFLQALDKNNIKYSHLDQLKPALKNVLDKVTPDDIILLLGAHAMDEAGDMILEMIKE